MKKGIPHTPRALPPNWPSGPVPARSSSPVPRARRYRARLPPDHLAGIEGEWIRVTPCLPCPPWPHSSTPPPRSTSPPRSLDPVDLDEVRRHGHHDRPRPHGHCPPCGLGACRGSPNAFATSSAPTRSSERIDIVD